MRGSPAVVIVFGFMVGLAFGCGSKQVDVPSGGGAVDPPPKLGDLAKQVAPNELPPAVVKLYELEKRIAAKEKELTDLKAEATVLRQSIVYRTPGELLADMPKDAHPKFGADAGIERAKARKWVKANLVGRTIEAELNVIDGGVTVTGNDPYTVHLAFNQERSKVQYFAESSGVRVENLNGTPFGGVISLGGQPSRVYVGWGSTISSGAFTKLSLSYSGCSEAEATKLKGFNKQKVRLRATITDTLVGDSGAIISEPQPRVIEDALPIGLACTIPSIDGFLPEASKTKPKESKLKPKDVKK